MSNIITNNKLDYLETVKADIKSAIIEKGQEVSDVDTFKSYADKIRAISGSSADVRYVTFMNGSTFLYKKPVAVGDDCVDVRTKGLIETPTKATTAQYNYTYSGWALTSGGSANSNALKEVTEDRTVYAAFTATVRKYTVNFYDGETLLKTEQVPYGGSIDYEPEKDYHIFLGWSPEPTNITSDMDCYANFKANYDVNLITDSWETILAAVTDGTYKNKYTIGNYKELDLGDEGLVNMQIAAFDADLLADGSGNAAISWVSKEMLKTRKQVNDTYVKSVYDYVDAPSWTFNESGQNWKTTLGTSKTEAKAKWTITVISGGTLTVKYCTHTTSTVLSALSLTINGTAIASNTASTSYKTHTLDTADGDIITIEATFTLKSGSSSYYGDIQFSSTGEFTTEADIQNATISVFAGYEDCTGAIGGWPKSTARSYYKDTIKPLIPDIVRNSIKEVNKYSIIALTDGTLEQAVSVEDVWMPSYREIFGADDAEQSGPIYATLFFDDAARVKTGPGADYTSSRWSLRTAYNYQSYRAVQITGAPTAFTTNYVEGMVLGFCI